MVSGKRTVDRYLKMALEKNIKYEHVEEKLGNWSVDRDMENMVVERYLFMGVAVEMTLKHGCIKRLGKCCCSSRFKTISETGVDQVVWEIYLYRIILGELLQR